MDDFTEHILDVVKCGGACVYGTANLESLAGGPETADITRVLPGARSAVAFAYPLDTEAIELFLSKKNRRRHERDNIDMNNMASGAALNLAGYLKMKGHEAVPIIANNYYRSDTPGAPLDMVPDLSLRFLAVAAGIGWLGLSGNVITPDQGAGVILGGLVTTADLEATPLLPEDENYCDGCKLCMASCASGLMDKKEMDSVTLGGKEFTYSKRNTYLRCDYVCGGYTGLHPSGQWSTWSPGRHPIPKTDDEFLPALIDGLKFYGQWPLMEGGFYHVLSPYKQYLTCGNCQLVCHPDKEERKRRHKMLMDGGVVVQNPDGSLEAVSPDEARERMAAMTPEKRALYETT